jgi:hypothetical protein
VLFRRHPQFAQNNCCLPIMASLLHLQLLGYLLVLGVLSVSFMAEALQTGDRISTMIQSLHGGRKTPLMDIGLHQMPRFRVKDSSIIRVSLPSVDANEPEMRLIPTEDLKMSLTFESNKLVLPWIVLFDSANKRSLKKLVITFAHDEYEVLRFRYELNCK